MSDNSISDEDRALFQRVMQGVKPLKSKNRLHIDIDEKKRAVPEKKMHTTIKHVPTYHKEAPLPTSRAPSKPIISYHASHNNDTMIGPESVLSYYKNTLPAKRLTQLKKGEIAWDARLDLHGLHLDTAQSRLYSFIEQHHHLAHRCLLIVHGKGSRFGDVSVLKNHVYHWLQTCPHILAFHSAQARDGGCGALYVLLQRQR